MQMVFSLAVGFLCLELLTGLLSTPTESLALPDTLWASQVMLVLKNLPSSAGEPETRIRPLGREDPLEEGTATHSSILAWRIPRTEEPGGLQSMVLQRVRTRLRQLSTYTCSTLIT